MLSLYYKLLDNLDQLADESGTDKLVMLRKMMQESPEFTRFITLALDYKTTFGVRVISYDGVAPLDSTLTFSEFEKEMMKLATRQVTGNDAQARLAALITMGVPHELLTRLCCKDLRCGVGAESVNKAVPKTIKQFKVALAEPYEEEAGPFFESPKWDGLRAIVLVDDANVQFLSRNGLAFPSLSIHADAFLALGVRNRMYDAEVISGSFLSSISAVKQKHKKAEDAQFQVFDTMSLEHFMAMSCPVPQDERLAELRHILKPEQCFNEVIKFCPHSIIETADEANAAFRRYRSKGIEGVILKKTKATYCFGRNSNWTKIKDVVTADVRVKRVVEGKGKYVGTMGAFVVDYKGVETNIGTGFSDKERADFWAQRDSIAEFGLLIEITFHEVTPDGSLRHGRFEKVRNDKSEADGEI